MQPRAGLGLAGKVTLAFGLVILTGAAAFSLLANQVAQREVTGFMYRGGMTDSTVLAGQLAVYYEEHGSWRGVEALFAPFAPGRGQEDAQGRGGMMGMGGMMNPALVLADPEGQVIAGTSLPAAGQVSESELRSGTPITVDGQAVGILLVEGSDGGTLGRELLGRVSRSIWLVGAIVGLVAMVVGGLLVAGLLRPVRELTAASRALAQGNLSRRVPVTGGDELGELSAAFNQMAESLQRSEALRRDMTADIAHELRNPLAILQAQVEALLDGVHQPTSENLKAIQGQTVLLAHLVEDLRTMALADAGQLRLEKVDTEIGELASRVVHAYHSQAEQAGVRLSLVGQPVWAEVDGLRLEQALGNLLGNALRHTPAAGEVTVRVGNDAQGSAAVIEVADSGEGVPEEALPSIFQRFYRADRSRSRSEGGTGLGLAITRRLVESHGGWLRAANRPQGGAVFTIGIPLRSSTATDHADNEQATH